MHEPRHVDGNALGGLLSEVFTVDLTTATTTCAGCGSISPLAVLDVFLDAPGTLGRCRTCGAVQLRFVRNATTTWLDLTGIQALEIPMAAEP